MKSRRRLMSVLTMGLLLALLSSVVTWADLIPGHVDTGFFPGVGADDEVLAVAVQADGKVLVGGYFTTFNTVARNRIARLQADGALDTHFDPGTGADNRVRAIAVQPDGKVLIAGSFTTFDGVAITRIARLNADGSLDTSFDPGAGADIAVRAMVLQDDGKVLIAGDFTMFDGVARNRIARLNADGSLDTTFDPGTGAGAGVNAVALQDDGKVLIGGSFTSFDGTEIKRIARLNTDGSLDISFAPPSTGATDYVEDLAVQDDGKVLIGGNFTMLGGTARNRIARLNANGPLDTSFDPGTGVNAVVHAVRVQPDGRVVIGGAFSTFDDTARNRIARLSASGALDTSFDPGAGADAPVWDTAIQIDGKVLIGGDFTTVDGTGRIRVARLNGDGTLDVGLDTGTGASDVVEDVAVQANGKVLIGGYFTSVDGEVRNRIAQLNANGSVDTSFDPGTGANSAVRALTVQPDGKVLIGGSFTTVDGTGRVRVARLNDDGSLDSGFDPGTGPSDTVLAVAAHDGKVIIGGYFTSVAGTGRNRIARLNGNGSLDSSFNPGTGANDWVLDLAVQSDGKVIIGGDFTTYDGIARNRIARLNSDGSLDGYFTPGTGANNYVRVAAVQPDGKVLIGGDFTQVNGISRNRIARLNTNGTLDHGFNPGTGANNWVDAIAVQEDGKVLIGGNFTAVDGVACNRIARLHADGSVDTGFITSAGADAYVYDVAVQPDGKVLIGGNFNRKVARLNGATPPTITSGVPPSTGKVGQQYSHIYTGSGYPWAPMFYVTGGSLPAGLTLDAASEGLYGSPQTAGNYTFTVSACNYVAPCDTQEGTLAVAKGDTATTITSHVPDPSGAGQPVTVGFSVDPAVGTPTGNVTVSDGVDSCVGTVAAGSCVITLNTLGSRTLIATYEGDDNFNGSVSEGVSHEVQEVASYKVFLPLVERQ